MREAPISAGFDRRGVLLAGAGLAAGCAATPWTPPAPVAFKIIEHQPIPMRDGVRVPTVLECIPYRKRDLYRAADDLWGPQLAAAGIAFVRLDVRGSGESEG